MYTNILFNYKYIKFNIMKLSSNLKVDTKFHEIFNSIL